MNGLHYAYNAPFNMVDKDGNKYRLKVERDDMAESPREWSNVTTMVCWHRRYNLGDKHDFDNVRDFYTDIIWKYVALQDVIDYVVAGRSQYVKIETDEDNVPMMYGKWSTSSDWYIVNPVHDLSVSEICEELSDEDLAEIVLNTDDIVIVPLYLYDHSGITISTGGFNDPWDSGKVGYAYIDKKTAMKELVACVLDENGERIKVEYKHEGHPSTWSYKTEPLTDENWKARAKEAIDEDVEVYDSFLRGDVYWYRLEKLEHYRDEKKCPHCGEVIEVDEYDEWIEVYSCGGFYGNVIEENGIMDYVTNLEFVD